MPKTIKRQVPVEAGRFLAQGKVCFAKGEGEDADKFELVPYAGQVFTHWWWGNMAFDMDGMKMRKSVIPALKDHMSSRMVGEIDSMNKDDGKIALSGTFLDTEAASEVKSTKKLDWECSLAFDLESAVIEEIGKNAKAEVNGKTVKGPGVIFRKTELYETSFTFFGAVPGTGTKFDKNGPTKEVTIFSEEPQMTDQEVQDKVTEGKAEVQALFSQMNELCEDKAFVAECFAKNMTLDEFQKELLKKQQSDIAALAQKNNELSEAAANIGDPAEGPPPAKFSQGSTQTPPESDDGEKDLNSLAKDLQKAEKLSYREALRRVVRENTEVYKKANPLAEVQLSAKV